MPARMAKIVLLLLTAGVVGSPAQSLTTLVSFTGTNGAYPTWNPIVQAANGYLYGMTSNGALAGGTIYQISPTNQVSVLYTFCAQPQCADGSNPQGGLAFDDAGNLYGTTSGGGTEGGGTIFKITTQGVLTTLHDFEYSDGASPWAGLVYFGGIFYGTTVSGGSAGNGTIFSITPQGTLTTLYSFCSKPDCKDGYSVTSPLTAANGILWGTTYFGGTDDVGTIFQITPTGTFTTLRSFDYKNGAQANGGLVYATDGNFYGTTLHGGDWDDGTGFRLTPTGRLSTVYSFCSVKFCPDGVWPFGGLIQGANGNLFGTTEAGGTHFQGSIFEISTTGKLTTLYNFCSETKCADGSAPQATLVQSTNGNLYGTTSLGGSNNAGTLFQFTP
jgi:uncharacterized repeat protein (TIGR03803 family)